MHKIILCDTDDTTLHCADALEDYITKTFGIAPIRPLRDAYHVSDAFGVSKEVGKEYCKDFWHSDAFFNLKPMTCALNVIPKLYANDYRFVAITACLNTDVVKTRRKQNLENAFGIPWENVFCTHGISKGDILKLFSPTIWVEDHLENCKLGPYYGHKSFLLNRIYNQSDDATVTRINDWYDVERLL